MNYAPNLIAPVQVPDTMAYGPNAWVTVQACRIEPSLGAFAVSLGRSAERLEADRAAAAAGGHEALIYRVQEPAVDVPPSLLLGRIDPDGDGVVMLNQEQVPGFGVRWTCYAGDLNRKFQSFRDAQRFLDSNPRRSARDSWRVVGLYVAPING